MFFSVFIVCVRVDSSRHNTTFVLVFSVDLFFFGGGYWWEMHHLPRHVVADNQVGGNKDLGINTSLVRVVPRFCWSASELVTGLVGARWQAMLAES